MSIKISFDKKVVADHSGSSFINKSGVYPITINFVSVSEAKTGSQSVNFNITYEGNTQTLWGPYITNKEGEQLEKGTNLLIKLGIIAGMEEGDEFTLVEEEHAVGKDNKVQEFVVIDELSDLECIVHVQEEYSLWDDKIQQRLDIRNFFRSDGASAEEIVEDGEIGKQLALVKEKYADKVTYKDGLTAEDIEKWKADGYGKGKSKESSSSSSSSKRKSKLFGKK